MSTSGFRMVLICVAAGGFPTCAEISAVDTNPHGTFRLTPTVPRPSTLFPGCTIRYETGTITVTNTLTYTVTYDGVHECPGQSEGTLGRFGDVGKLQQNDRSLFFESTVNPGFSMSGRFNRTGIEITLPSHGTLQYDRM